MSNEEVERAIRAARARRAESDAQFAELRRAVTETRRAVLIKAASAILFREVIERAMADLSAARRTQT